MPNPSDRLCILAGNIRHTQPTGLAKITRQSPVSASDSGFTIHVTTPLANLSTLPLLEKHNLQTASGLASKTMAAQPKFPCKFFLQNSCTRGESCQYSHDRGLQSTGSRRPATVPPAAGPWRSATVSSTGSWRPAAVLVSTGSERSAAPTSGFRTNVPGVASTAPRTYSQRPSRSSGPFESTVVQDGNEGLLLPCKFFQKGFCSRGTTCKFAHVLVEGSQPSEQLPIDRDIPVKQTATTVNEVSLGLILSDVHEWILI